MGERKRETIPNAMLSPTECSSIKTSRARGGSHSGVSLIVRGKNDKDRPCS